MSSASLLDDGCCGSVVCCGSSSSFAVGTNLLDASCRTALFTNKEKFFKFPNLLREPLFTNKFQMKYVLEMKCVLGWLHDGVLV